MFRKAVDFIIKVAPLDNSTAPLYLQEIKALLDAGWDILSSTSFGIEPGGHAGAGAIQVYTALVKYQYYDVAPVSDEEDVPEN